MAMNRLAGSGPTTMSGSGDGPSPSLSGTLGVAPQAVQQQAPQNMLAQGGRPTPVGMPQAASPQGQMQPPSPQKLMDVMHKQHFVMATLKDLLSKPDLSKKDVLGAVGQIVADGIMGPFDAAKYLRDFPTDADPLTLRQWVGTHYANAAKNYQTVTSMLEAHGQMVRRQQAGMPVQSNAPMPQAPSNQLSTMQ